MSLKLARVGGLLSLLCLGVGCQMQQTVSTVRLIQHQAMIDFSGLKDSEICEPVKVHVSPPAKWEALTPKRATLYTDMQWRSPSKMTGVGVAYIHLPIPLPASALLWFAKQEYSKKSEDGEVLGQWTDDLGRPWFEAQNVKYRIRGYIVTKGFDAWIIYSGYKREQPPSAVEMGVAARSLETIVPTPYSAHVPQRSMATAN